MSRNPEIDWEALDLVVFAKLPGAPSLRQYEKIGFPDSYGAGVGVADIELN